VKKVYKKLTEEQKQRGVVFSSCLSKYRTEQSTDLIHEVLKDDSDISGHITRLKDDRFFNGSPWNFNIIRE
jgi:hypothetical protein